MKTVITRLCCIGLAGVVGLFVGGATGVLWANALCSLAGIVCTNTIGPGPVAAGVFLGAIACVVASTLTSIILNELDDA